MSSLLAKDNDFKIEKTEKNTIIIKALRNESFNNNFVMAKIIGRIIPFNCKLKINLKNLRAENFKDDQLIYDFSINTDDLLYKGTIYIIR